MSKADYMMPHYHSQAFLPPELNQEILDNMLEDLATFDDAKVFSVEGGKSGVNLESRVAKTANLRPAMFSAFKSAVSQALPEIVPKIGLKMRDDFKFEIGAAMHQDGGFFTRHIDTRTGPSEGTARYISAVYYLSRTPQQFTGGQFRLHSLIGDSHLDFEATNNALLVFPSFAPHEVLPISVPSGKPEDGRFSINCWVRVPRSVP